MQNLAAKYVTSEVDYSLKWDLVQFRYVICLENNVPGVFDGNDWFCQNISV